jgi:hypothetical protein
MPLQIRRGTEAEKDLMTQPLAPGELLYTTDGQRLYIGNGVRAGANLIPVTGYTNEDAQDAAASMLTSGVHTGITFTYGITQDAAGRIDAAIDLSNYNSVISGDLRGSVFADDSTLNGIPLIDGTNGKINLNGTINDDVIPDSSETYDLGSGSFRFKDLWLSGNSIYLGDAVITTSGSAVNLPAGSLVDGVPIGSGSGNGVVDGSDYRINIVGDDSSIIVDFFNYRVTAAGGFIGNVDGNLDGNVTGDVSGNLTGNVIGEVLNQSNATLVSGISKILSNTDLTITSNVLSSNIADTLIGTTINVGSPSDLASTSLLLTMVDSQPSTVVRSIGGDSPVAISKMSFSAYGTEFDTPTRLLAGDYVGGFGFGGFEPTVSNDLPIGLMLFRVDPNATPSATNLNGKLEILVDGGTSGLDPKYLTFDSKGWLAINQQSAQATLDINGFAKLAILTAAPASPTAGMIAIADGTTWNPVSNGKQSVVAYLGSAWVLLAAAA